MNRPIVRGAAAWCIGNALSYAYSPIRDLSDVAMICAIVVLLIAAWQIPGRSYWLLSAIVVAGALYFSAFDHRNVSQLTAIASSAATTDGFAAEIEGTIDSPVQLDGDRVTFRIRADRVITESETIILRSSELVKVNVRLLEQTDQAEVLQWARADEVLIKGLLQQPQEARNFGGFDYREYMRLHRIHLLLNAKGLNAVVISKPDGWNTARVLSKVDGIRNRLSIAVERLFPESHAGYMKGLLIGMSDEMNPQQYGQFTTLGLTHVLAISGMHVAVVIAVLLWLLKQLRFTKETSIKLTIISLPFYIVLTGGSPSVVRAGLTGMLGLYLIKRQLMHTGIELVAVVGWAMLIWNPYQLLDVSFQLSFAVTIGLLLAMPTVNRLLPGKFPFLENSTAITIVAQVVSFPLSIYYFNQFSVLSWLANLVLVPIISFVTTPVGGAALIISFVVPIVADGLAQLIVWLNEVTFIVTEKLASWRDPVVLWPSPPFWWLFIYYTAVIGLLGEADRWGERRKLKRDGIRLSLPSHRMGIYFNRVSQVAMILLVICFFAYAYKPDAWSHKGYVSFLDVGQGDAIYIRTPSGKRLLIDGGGTVSFRKPGEEWKERHDPYEVGAKMLVPLLKKRGVHEMDFVIISHEDADHIGGLQAVLEQIPVKRLLFNGTVKPTPGAEKLLTTAITQEIPLTPMMLGRHLVIDAYTTLDFLYPVKESGVTYVKDQNNQSLVFLLTMAGRRILFTGDIDAATEAQVISTTLTQTRALGSGVGSWAGDVVRFSGPIDILKVAHHGSKSTTTEAWLSYWQPRLAVISVGAKNSYGHPSKPVLDRLKQRKIDILRTDQNGEIAIEILTSGQMTVRTRWGE